VLLLSLLTLSASALPSASATTSDTTEGGSGEAEELDYQGMLYAILPDGVRESFEGAEEPTELVGFTYLFSYLIVEAGAQVPSACKVLFTLLGIAALGAMTELLGEDCAEGLKKPLTAVVGVVCALAFYGTLRETLTRVETYLNDLLHFSEALSPILGGILVTGGAVKSGAVATASMTGLLLLTEKLCVGVLTPLAGACFAFSMLGGISDEVRVDGIAKNLRGLYLTILGVLCTVAGASYSMQTLLASSSDSVAMRTARYAVGNMIPLVGGTIGASLGTLGASLSLIKNTVGVCAVVVILLLTIPVLVDLYLTRLAVSLTGAFARLMGFRAGEKLLGEFRGIFDMTLAVTAFTSLTFILYLAVFLRVALPYAV
jgi:stage III sporulation protein AE